MGEHFVIVYIDEVSRRFTGTARMARANMAAVERWAGVNNYARLVIGEGLNKDEADALLARTRANYEAMGYEYQMRTEG
jgi:hypothetical protein